MSAPVSEPRGGGIAIGAGESPRVTIVLATYNGARHLARQIDSLLAQDYPVFDILASDDASSDGTQGILADYEGRFPDRISVLYNEHNLGFVGNFERGIKMAMGDYIALSDQDDVWLPGKLSELVPLLARGAGLAFSDLEIVDEGLAPLGYGMWKTIGLGKKDLSTLRGCRAFEALMRRNVVTGCALIARRDLAQASLPFPPLRDFVHDQWLALIASFFGPLAPCPSRLVLYRQHDSQQTGGERSTVAEIAMAESRRRDLGGYEEGWAPLFERLDAMGADAAKIAWAKDWVRRRGAALRLREENPGLRTVARLAASGAYFEHFSGIRSLARDLLRLARRNSRSRPRQ